MGRFNKTGFARIYTAVLMGGSALLLLVIYLYLVCIALPVPLIWPSSYIAKGIAWGKSGSGLVFVETPVEVRLAASNWVCQKFNWMRVMSFGAATSIWVCAVVQSINMEIMIWQINKAIRDPP